MGKMGKRREGQEGERERDGTEGRAERPRGTTSRERGRRQGNGLSNRTVEQTSRDDGDNIDLLRIVVCNPQYFFERVCTTALYILLSGSYYCFYIFRDKNPLSASLSPAAFVR